MNKVYIGHQSVSKEFSITTDMFVRNLNLYMKHLNWHDLFDDTLCGNNDDFFDRICESLEILDNFAINDYMFLIEREDLNDTASLATAIFTTFNLERYYIDFINEDDAVKFKLMYKGPNNG